MTAKKGAGSAHGSKGGLPKALAAAVAAEAAGQQYGALGPAIKKALAAQRARYFEKYARGDVIAEKIASDVDQTIRFLLNYANPDFPCAILATGGYGRGSLAPMSDIDLLILHEGGNNGSGDEALKPFLEKCLYPLWDAGLVVGHGVHSPATAIKLAKNDLNACTAFLEARYLCGDEALSDAFLQKYQKLRESGRRQFIKDKLAEQAARHETALSSHYMTEPDIKEGRGGLRDVHLIRWLHAYVFGDRKKPSILSSEEWDALEKAERFLLSIRAHLHDLRPRADDRLTFDIQPALAARLGYRERARTSAGERMMRHYFVNTKEILRLSHLYLARLDEHRHNGLTAPKPLPKSLSQDEAPGKPNLRLRLNRLDFASPAKAKKRPLDFFRLFRALSKKPSLDLHPDALAIITDRLADITADIRRDRVVSTLFLSSLVKTKEPARVLRLMSETGLLGKYLPSFGRILGRIEYGLYRRYPLEEQVFRSVNVLAALRRGDLENAHEQTTKVVAAWENPTTLYLMVLLHEMGWSLEAPSTEKTERLIKSKALRLHLSTDDASLVAWCAARTMFLTQIAERRNLNDTRVLENFAKEVGDKKRLDALLVLTICHLRVVSDTSWDAWTRSKVRALYMGAGAYLENGRDGLQDWIRQQEQNTATALQQSLPRWSAARREEFLARIVDNGVTSVPLETLARAAMLSDAAEKNGQRAAVSVEVVEGAIEAIIFAADRSGFLADLAGAVSAIGGSVRSVNAMTLSDGNIIDVFAIQPGTSGRVGGAAETDDEEAALHALAKKAHEALLQAAKSPPKKAFNAPRRLGDRRGLFDVPSLVRLDLDASEDCLVLEAEGRDRAGLLYRLARELSDIGLIIRSAHIATYGERAVDVFYLQDAPGYKITNKRRLQSIERRVLAALNEA